MSSNHQITTPVLLLIFNRPDLTLKVFNAIREVQPSILFVAADGPRGNISDDISKCEETRKIVKKIDWDCDLKTLFRDENLGCRLAVSAAIDWFFEHIDAGIILEDDCFPSRSFFRFCQELLAKYRYDERIMQISGTNYLFEPRRTDYSYYFSKLNGVTGWATWRRAWKCIDSQMVTFAEFKQKKMINDYINDQEISDWIMSYLEEASKPDCGIWSTRWLYAIIVRNGLTINPIVNLVEHIGVGKEVTNTQPESAIIYSKMGHHELGNMKHPPFVLPDNEADELSFQTVRKIDPRLADKKDANVFDELWTMTVEVGKTIKSLFGKVPA